jgi:mono/diheme cytochrome c family protein
VERTAFDVERGRLLYENACGACHTTQPHWRERRLVNDWNGLVQQVTRWQGIAGQNWSRPEIGDVSAYLNQRFYRLRCDAPGCAGPPG